MTQQDSIAAPTDDDRDIDETDAPTGEKAATPDTDAAGKEAAPPRTPARRQITISMRALGTAVVIAALIVAVAVFVVRDLQARDSLQQSRSAAADRARAEQIAGEYAIGAATLDYNDLTPWIANVKKGVSPELQKQYDVVGQAMQQIMVPLRMQMTSTLVLAKTTNVVGSMYEVQAVVDTNIRSAQAPDGAGSTAVYSLTMDKAKNWQIDKVGDPTKLIANNLQGAQPSAAQPSGAPAPAGATAPPAVQPAPTPAG